jgi:GNAT superfamily N-acetyltransferase
MFIVRAFEGATEATRRPGLNQFKEHWLASPEREAALAGMEASLADPRTIAELILVDRNLAGFLWATFEGEPYVPVFAELRLVAFKVNFQRQGLGRVSMYHLEELAAERGASSVHSTGSAVSEGIRRFHVSLGFQAIQTIYEKKIVARTQ